MNAMATDNDNVISTLNNLIETCKDGENGFRTAADGVKNSELKTLFLTYSQQRAQFAAELQAEVRNLGGDPEDTGSIAAGLHRGWINIKSTVTGEDEGAVISECERGEDSAVKNYKEALNEDLPANLQSIVQRQLTEVKEAHDRIRALEKATSAGA
jgi:uncharacterized protein (TIGR02284 family)